MGTRFRFSRLLFLATMLFGVVAGAQEITTGAIEGTVLDTKNEALPGVTVTLTSSQGTKSATTDASGAFRFNYLTPGAYKLSAALQGFNTVERQNVDVRLGSRVRIEVVLSPGVSEKIDVVGSAPVVDLNTNTSGATISSELMKSVPVGRTFSDTLALAPGVVDGGIDSSNPSIGGASGLENAYVVDGVNIGNAGYGSAGSYSIVYGSLGTGVNFDYIEEVQVKTGGYEPEFGEALGGFINLVTKSGGNELKGSGFVYYQPSWADGDREKADLIVANQTVTDTSSIEENNTDLGIDIGGPLAQDKAFWYGAFNPTWEKFERRTIDVIRNSQGIDHTLERERRVYNYAGNAKWFANSQHTLSFSAFGDPSEAPMGPQNNTTLTIEDPEGRFSEFKYGGNNMIGKWNGELMSNWFVEASLAYHTDKFEETPFANSPQNTDLRPTNLGEPSIRYGGLGFIGNSKSTSTQYRAKFSNFFEAAGEHNLRYGIEYQDIGYNASTEYSGPAGALFSADGLPSTTGFISEISPGSPSNADPHRQVDHFRIVRTRFNSDLFLETGSNYFAGFVSDSWNITKRFNVMAGIRYERDELTGGGDGAGTQTWGGNWGPRFHATFDATGDNKTKLGFSWGRFFGKIPADLAFRALSAEIQATQRYDLADVDLSDPNNPVIRPGAVPFVDVTIGSSPTEFVEGSKITFQDEYVMTAEREVVPFFNLGVNVTYRNLGRTLEDFALSRYTDIANGDDTFGNYVIGNPSESYPDLFPDPARKYWAFTLRGDKRLHENWQLLASYTWSKLEGNYEGYYRRDNGQSDPFITSLYDFPMLNDLEVWGNSVVDNNLPNDRTHVFNFYGSYLWSKLTLGAGLRVASGNPISRLGFNDVYGNSGEILLTPRGTDGTGDTATNFDIHVDYPLSLGAGQISLIADVFNLFNGQSGLDYDQEYEIVERGGEVNGDFGRAYRFQSPRQFRFAARYSF